MKFSASLAVLAIVSLLGILGFADEPPVESAAAVASRRPDDAAAAQSGGQRRGKVRVEGHCLVDDQGPFLGLGVSYFTALWRCKHDRARLEADCEFLSRQGFHYYRMLSMVGHNAAWDGLEIAPVSFQTREGKYVEAWPDYWRQLRELIDLTYDRYGMRTQITIFADAQLMPAQAGSPGTHAEDPGGRGAGAGAQDHPAGSCQRGVAERLSRRRGSRRSAGVRQVPQQPDRDPRGDHVQPRLARTGERQGIRAAVCGRCGRRGNLALHAGPSQ